MPDTRPVVFGEVLFDCFSDTATLGGAPFNVAWHLHGFGLEPLFVSRVGEDALGARVAQRMNDWGMDTSALQRDPVRATGTVTVTVADGEPRYDILDHQAYDAIEWTALARNVDEGAALLYHGTLGARHPESAATLNRLKQAFHGPTFVDVNLRAPWWRTEQVHGLVNDAAYVKLNDQELVELQGGAESEEASAERFRAAFGISTLFVTKGEAGAMAVSDGIQEVVNGVKVEPVVDTVGAGDAFSSVVIVGLLRHWMLSDILARAAAFAAEVCRQRGAVVDNPEVYRETMERWEDVG